MTKLKHDIIIAFKSRPLSVVALLMIAGIVIMYKADILYAGYSDYCIDSDNELSKCGIYPGDTIRLSGKVYDISQKEFYGKLSMTITLSDVIWEYNNIPLTRKRQYIQVYSDVSDVKMGQEITVEGKIKYFEKATNEGQFDAYSFYRNRGILFSLEKGNIIRKSAKYSRIRQCLYSIKMNSEQILDEKLGQEDAAIAKAMILGMKGDIDKEIKESFQKNGIAHILAISGLHISFLCMTLYRLLQKLRIPVWLSVTVSILFLVAYVLMVGFSASAFRAAVMFILYLLATALKRTYDLMTAL